MPQQDIPEDVRRFVLTSVPSVPWLEAALLFQREQVGPRTAREVAGRLYLPEDTVAELLARLCESGVLAPVDKDPPSYKFAPSTEELRALLVRVAETYARHLVPMTTLIHSKAERQAQTFADAFKLRKDP